MADLPSTTDSESTIVVFFSITGGVGKSFLAGHLFECWRATRERHSEQPTYRILVDADVVWAALSRSPLFDAESLSRARTTALDLMDAPVDLLSAPGPKLLVPAAPWVSDLSQVPQLERQASTVKDRYAQHVLMDRRLRLEENLGLKMDRAQHAQAQLLGNLDVQQRFWGNLSRAALSAPCVIIVDLPAQGPSGVSLQMYWRTILGDARREARRGRHVERLRLVRVLVHADQSAAMEDSTTIEPEHQWRLPASHPLVKQFIEGVKRDVPEYRDVVICQNFSRGNNEGRTIGIPAFRDSSTPSAMTSLIKTISTISGIVTQHDGSVQSGILTELRNILDLSVVVERTDLQGTMNDLQAMIGNVDALIL